jgi:hypothetical protein
MPFSTVSVRMAWAIFALATSQMPSASWVVSSPSSRPRPATASRAAPASSVMEPPAKFDGSTRPRTTLASVTVGWVPPRP